MGKHKTHKPRGRTIPTDKEYREMLKGQTSLSLKDNSESIYKRLLQEHRQDRFLGVVQYCSSKGKTVEETIEFIRAAFPNYFDATFTEAQFLSLVSTYPDVNEAWGYGTLGDEISEETLLIKGFSLARNSSNLDDLIKFKDAFLQRHKPTEANSTNTNNQTTTFTFHM